MSETKILSKDELAKHTTKKDLWIGIHGKVYDVTKYAEDHPGGVDSFVEVAGTDATEPFEDLGHTQDARETMAKFLVGDLEGGEEDVPEKIERHLQPVQELAMEGRKHGPLFTIPHVAMMSGIFLVGFGLMRSVDRIHLPHLRTTSVGWLSAIAPMAVTTSVISLAVIHFWSKFAPPKKNLPAHFKVLNEVARPSKMPHGILDPRQYVDLPVAKREDLSHNTVKFTLSLPKPNDILGLPIGQHIAIRGEANGKQVNRSYTPTSSNKDRGRLELVIKLYNDGQLTGGYLSGIKEGDKLSISGPRGHMRYRKGMYDSIGMLAGGTGITPMFQIIRAICEDPTDNTKVSLIYANNSEEDILLRDELDGFAKQRKDQFSLYYVLSKAPPGWKGGVGRATPELVKERFPSSDKKHGAMLCGPPGMVNAAKGWLVEQGFDEPRAVSKITDQVFLF